MDTCIARANGRSFGRRNIETDYGTGELYIQCQSIATKANIMLELIVGDCAPDSDLLSAQDKIVGFHDLATSRDTQSLLPSQSHLLHVDAWSGEDMALRHEPK